MEIIMLLNLINIAPVALSDASSQESAKIIWNLYSFVCSGIGNETARGILMFVAVLLCIASAYLIGSINPAIIFSKNVYHEDIRSFGSGNAGTTNMLRTYGKKMAILIFVLDFFKAALAIGIGSLLLSINVGGAISALFVVLGHMFPVYYRFKGGKGVACTAACILLLSPISFAILLPVFIIIVLATRFISLGSIISAMLFPLIAYAFREFWGTEGGFIPLAAIMIGAFVVFMHRENIKRLLEGKESKISFKKKDKHSADEHNGEEAKYEKAEIKPEKEYTEDDFIKCSCGRIIPVTREKCVYCGEKNPSYRPKENKNGKKK